MMAARPWLRMLPIPRGVHLACDVRSIAIAYSFLWLPIAYFVWSTWSASRDVASRADATFIVAVGLAIAMALQALAMQGRPAAMLLALFGAAAYCVGPSLAWPGSWLLLLAAIALAGFALASGYERPARLRSASTMVLPFGSHLAAASGLALPIAWRDLRHAIGLRMAWMAVIAGAGAWLARDGAFCGRRTGLMLVETALVVLAMYRVPALVDERLCESMPWLFRLGTARRRAIAAATVFTAAGFAVVFLASSSLWAAECGPINRPAIAWTFSVTLAVLSLCAFRAKEASAWIAIVVLLAVTFASGEML
jgi:hypothetical protein